MPDPNTRSLLCEFALQQARAWQTLCESLLPNEEVSPPEEPAPAPPASPSLTWAEFLERAYATKLPKSGTLRVILNPVNSLDKTVHIPPGLAVRFGVASVAGPLPMIEWRGPNHVEAFVGGRMQVHDIRLDSPTTGPTWFNPGSESEFEGVVVNKASSFIISNRGIDGLSVRGCYALSTTSISRYFIFAAYATKVTVHTCHVPNTLFESVARFDTCTDVLIDSVNFFQALTGREGEQIKGTLNIQSCVRVLVQNSWFSIAPEISKVNPAAPRLGSVDVGQRWRNNRQDGPHSFEVEFRRCDIHHLRVRPGSSVQVDAETKIGLRE